jgi:hypothetical protein
VGIAEWLYTAGGEELVGYAGQFEWYGYEDTNMLQEAEESDMIEAMEVLAVQPVSSRIHACAL